MLADDGNPAHAEAALLALGGWRDARAFGVLKAQEPRFLADPRTRELYLASVAMTRQPAAIDHLFELAFNGPPAVRALAVAALEALRSMPAVATRLEGIPKPADAPRRKGH